MLEVPTLEVRMTGPTLPITRQYPFKPLMRASYIQQGETGPTTLILRHVGGLGVVPPNFFRGLPGVTTLVLENLGIVSISAEAFSDLPNLDTLYLNGNRMSSLIITDLPSTINDLTNNHITRGCVPKGVTVNPSLTLPNCLENDETFLKVLRTVPSHISLGSKYADVPTFLPKAHHICSYKTRFLEQDLEQIYEVATQFGHTVLVLVFPNGIMVTEATGEPLDNPMPPLIMRNRIMTTCSAEFDTEAVIRRFPEYPEFIPVLFAVYGSPLWRHDLRQHEDLSFQELFPHILTEFVVTKQATVPHHLHYTGLEVLAFARTYTTTHYYYMRNVDNCRTYSQLLFRRIAWGARLI